MIRLSKSSISDAEISNVISVLKKEYLGMGEEVRKFEIELEKYFGRGVVCVNSGTSALHLALQAIGVGPGDEVLVPSLTYVATYQAISATGAIPVSVDVSEDSLLISADDARSKLTNNTKAILPVFYASNTSCIEEVYSFAEKNNLRVVEDAAHCFFNLHKGRKLGSFGDIVCFSFDGIKNITSGEGGCVVTSDKAVLKRIQDARLLGVEGDSDNRNQGKRTWSFDVKFQGWRYHMSDVMAAIGRAQLKRVEEFSIKRRALAQRYVEKLLDFPKVSLVNKNFDEVVPHIFVVRVKDRDATRDKLLERGVQTGIHYVPNHFHSLYQTKQSLPVTEKVFRELLTLPLHVDLNFEDIDFVVDQLKRVVLDE